MARRRAASNYNASRLSPSVAIITCIIIIITNDIVGLAMIEIQVQIT